MAHLSGGVLGLLLLAAIVWAIVNVAQSQASSGAKALWIVLLLVLPVIGLVIWLIAGPRALVSRR
ncbi:MAG: PLD nuclease N-terminal domain-containing protein [Kiloniellales bacterium]